MTWTATQPELPSRMAADDLSEPAALAHFCAIAWIQATERFECTIPRRMLAVALPLTYDVPAVEKELAAAGYWSSHDKCVELIDHAGYTRRSLTRVEKKRKTDAVASKRYRDKPPADPPPADPPSATDGAADGAARGAAESDSDAAPRLPTELTTNRPSRSESEENGPPLDCCRHCGEPTQYLLGGYCRRAQCTDNRRKGAA